VGGAPKVKTLIFRPIPEHAVRVAALQTAEIDIAVNIPPHWCWIEQHPRSTLQGTQRAADLHPIYTYQFDTATSRWTGRGPDKDKRVRQAILAASRGRDHQERARGEAIRTATRSRPSTSASTGRSSP